MSFLQNLQLADPNFGTHGKFDLLFGIKHVVSGLGEEKPSHCLDLRPSSHPWIDCGRISSIRCSTSTQFVCYVAFMQSAARAILASRRSSRRFFLHFGFSGCGSLMATFFRDMMVMMLSMCPRRIPLWRC